MSRIVEPTSGSETRLFLISSYEPLVWMRELQAVSLATLCGPHAPPLPAVLLPPCSPSCVVPTLRPSPIWSPHAPLFSQGFCHTTRRWRPPGPPVPDGPSFRPRRWENILSRQLCLDPYVSEDPALDEILDLLSDEYARDILAAASEKPMSANELAEQCGMSEPTVYRRISSLQEHELVAEQTKIETGGNDYKLYVATLSGFSLELEDGSFESSLERRSAPEFPGHDEADTADRFKKMWENL